MPLAIKQRVRMRERNPMIAKSNLKKVSLKSVGAVVASGALVAAMAVPAFAIQGDGTIVTTSSPDNVST